MEEVDAKRCRLHNSPTGVRQGRRECRLGFEKSRRVNIERFLSDQNFEEIKYIHEYDPPVFARFEVDDVENVDSWSPEFKALVVQCMKEGSLVPCIRRSTMAREFHVYPGRFHRPFSRVGNIMFQLGLWEDFVKRFTPLFYKDIVLPSRRPSHERYVVVLRIMQQSGGRIEVQEGTESEFYGTLPEMVRRMYKLLNSKRYFKKWRIPHFVSSFIVGTAFNVPLRQWLRKGYELEHAGEWTKVWTHYNFARGSVSNVFCDAVELQTDL